MSDKRALIIIGAGGHASVLLDILLSQGQKVIAYISPEPAHNKRLFEGLIHLPNDRDINKYTSSEVLLVNGIGHMPKSELRSVIYNNFVKNGYQFTSVIAKSAIVSKYALIAKDAQVLTGAIIHAGASIGTNSIVNTSVIVEHDSEIRDHVHLAPNVTVCGNSVVGSKCFIGASATIIQDIVIGQQSVLGAGVTILQSINHNEIISPKRNLK